MTKEKVKKISKSVVREYEGTSSYKNKKGHVVYGTKGINYYRELSGMKRIDLVVRRCILCRGLFESFGDRICCKSPDKLEVPSIQGHIMDGGW